MQTLDAKRASSIEQMFSYQTEDLMKRFEISIVSHVNERPTMSRHSLQKSPLTDVRADLKTNLQSLVSKDDFGLNIRLETGDSRLILETTHATKPQDLSPQLLTSRTRAEILLAAKRSLIIRLQPNEDARLAGERGPISCD